MAACGSLQHIFENPLPENPTSLLESLSSWKPVKPIEQPSFTTEIFGELHFKENSAESPPCPAIPVSPVSSSCLIESLNINDGSKYSRCHKSSDSFSSMSSDSLQLCTEGLGFESSDDVEDMGNEMSEDWQNHEEKIRVTRHHHFPSSENHGGEFRRSRTSGAGGGFPPPISCIGKSGKPWVCFKSYRQDGRFVLKQIRVPTQEFLHACREDGRLKLHLVQPNDEILEEEEEEEMDDEDQEDTDDDDKEGKEDDDGGRNRGKDAESFVIAR